ncbi:hypothetical protein [Muriicola soli]|uniref:Uncharacterized protein n=1 Tax=Muriicola soli TaxID=2507538 RepID=A0A411EBM1_9FLAO|nr:hypothetical protein [Muriicola soli]QBA65132.1 hypothetical protein EQY75_11700 [Muriicola soli]
MAKEQLDIIKEADLTNNCPECFNQELKLTFYQKHVISKFYNKTTGEVSQDIRCVTCGSVIYPVSWTEDIERSFEYFQKMVVPQPKRIKLTQLSFVLIFLFLTISAALFYLYFTGVFKDVI